MTRFARLNDPDPRIRGKLQAQLYYARKENREKRKQALGPNIIVNGEFETDDDWIFFGESEYNPSSKTASVKSTGDYSYVGQNLSGLTVGATYILEFDQISNTGAGLKIEGAAFYLPQRATGTALGRKRVSLLAISPSGLLEIARNGVTDTEIDNVTLQRVG